VKPDLDGRRTPGELVAETFAAFRAHATVFFTMSLILVAPVTIAIDGVWGRALADGADASIPLTATYVAVVLQVVIVAACGIDASAPSASARPQMPSTTIVIGATRISDIVQNTVACAVKSANVAATSPPASRRSSRSSRTRC